MNLNVLGVKGLERPEPLEVKEDHDGDYLTIREG